MNAAAYVKAAARLSRSLGLSNTFRRAYRSARDHGCGPSLAVFWALGEVGVEEGKR